MLPEPKPLIRALSFADVIVMPGGPVILPDKVSLDTPFNKTHTLKRPLLGLTADPAVALALAQQGGLGILADSLSFGQQVEAVRRLKRHQAKIVRQPYTVTPDTIVAEAQDLQNNHRFSALPVLDPVTRKLVGLVTRADVARAEDPSDPVSHIMVTDLLTVAEDAPDAEVQKILQDQMVGQVPVVDAAGRLVGLRTASDFAKRAAYPHALLDAQGRLLAAVAITPSPEAPDRISALLDMGADIFWVHAAHGHSAAMQDIVTYIRRQRCEQIVTVIAGAVGTGDGARALIDSGADALFVSADDTQVRESGIGVPGFTALQKVCDAASLLDIPVWVASPTLPDAGLTLKALAAGARGLCSPILEANALSAWSDKLKMSLGQCGAMDAKNLSRLVELASVVNL